MGQAVEVVAAVQAAVEDASSVGEGPSLAVVVVEEDTGLGERS